MSGPWLQPSDSTRVQGKEVPSGTLSLSTPICSLIQTHLVNTPVPPSKPPLPMPAHTVLGLVLHSQLRSSPQWAKPWGAHCSLIWEIWSSSSGLIHITSHRGGLRRALYSRIVINSFSSHNNPIRQGQLHLHFQTIEMIPKNIVYIPTFLDV